MSDLFHKIDTTLIYPPMLAKCRDAVERCQRLGAIYFATLGFRTFEEQDDIYAQGRTKPGAIVTHARGGESAHCFGLAIDFTHSSGDSDSGLHPDWEPENYQTLVECLSICGLSSGIAYRDLPHANLKNYITAAQLAPLRAIYEAAPPLILSLSKDVRAKLAAVWRHIDAAAAHPES